MSGPIRVSLDATSVPADPAGAGRYVLELATAVSRYDDVRVVVVSRRDDGRRWRAITGDSVVDQGPRRRPVRLVWEQLALPGVLRRLDVDVHHGPHYTMPERAKLPRVVTVHDVSFLEHPEWHERTKVRFFRRAIRVAAARADALVAVSDTTARRLTALLSPSAPVHVIPHGVDHSRYRPLAPDDDAGSAADRAALARLGVRPPYIAFVGTLEPRKDVPTLVRAFDRLAAARSPDLALVLAGAPGWGMDAVEAAVRAAAHRSRIHLPGYVSEAEKIALLRGAAAVAYPSLDEGFGLPALEALACGTPLVTSKGTAMDEMAGEAALLVAPRDTDSLADALLATLGGGVEVERRRRLGFETAASHTWDASAAAHVAVYRSVR